MSMNSRALKSIFVFILGISLVSCAKKENYSDLSSGTKTETPLIPLEINPKVLDFKTNVFNPQAAVKTSSLEVTITNTNNTVMVVRSVALTNDINSRYSLDSNTCAQVPANTSCKLKINYDLGHITPFPSETDVASLSIDDVVVSVKGRVEGSIIEAADKIDFQMLPQSATPATFSYRVNNVGNMPLVINPAIEQDVDHRFSVVGTGQLTIAPAESKDVVVQFVTAARSPSLVPHTAKLRLSPSFAVPVSGVVAESNLMLVGAGTLIDFPSGIRLGETNTSLVVKEFSIKNNGNLPAVVKPALDLGVSRFVAEVPGCNAGSPCQINIAPGASANVKLRLKTDNSALISDANNIRVPFNLGSDQLPVLSVKGRVEDVVLAMPTAPLHFGEVAFGGPVATKTVEITNSGNIVAQNLCVRIEPTSNFDFGSGTLRECKDLAPGSKWNVSVRMKTDAFFEIKATELNKLHLVLEHALLKTPVVASITGAVVGSKLELALQNLPDLGTHPVTAGGFAQGTIKVLNKGNRPFTNNSSITFADPSGTFSLVAPNCPAINVGASCDWIVKASLAQPVSANVNFVVNAPAFNLPPVQAKVLVQGASLKLASIDGANPKILALNEIFNWRVSLKNDGNIDANILPDILAVTPDTKIVLKSPNSCNNVVKANGGTCNIELSIAPQQEVTANPNDNYYFESRLSFGNSALAPIHFKARVNGIVLYGSNLDFGTVGVNASPESSVIIANRGNQEARISVALNGAGFELVAPICAVVAKNNGTCVQKVKMKSVAIPPPAPITGKMLIGTLDGKAKAEAEASISANVSAAVLQLSRSEIVFPDIVLGAKALYSQDLVLTNVGNKPALIKPVYTNITAKSPIAIVSSGASACGASVAAGAKCTIRMQISDTSAPGDHFGELSLGSVEIPKSVKVSARIVGAVINLALDRPAQVASPIAKDPRKFYNWVVTLANSGNKSASIVPNLVSDFKSISIIGDTCKGSVAAAAKCSLTISASLDKPITSASAVLGFGSELGKTVDFKFTILGSDLQLTMSPMDKDWGVVSYNLANPYSNRITGTIQNLGNQDASALRLAIDNSRFVLLGIGATAVRVGEVPCSKVLAKGSCSFDVAVDASSFTASGIDNGTLSFGDVNLDKARPKFHARVEGALLRFMASELNFGTRQLDETVIFTALIKNFGNKTVAGFTPVLNSARFALIANQASCPQLLGGETCALGVKMKTDKVSAGEGLESALEVFNWTVPGVEGALALKGRVNGDRWEWIQPMPALSLGDIYHDAVIAPIKLGLRYIGNRSGSLAPSLTSIAGVPGRFTLELDRETYAPKVTCSAMNYNEVCGYVLKVNTSQYVANSNDSATVSMNRSELSNPVVSAKVILRPGEDDPNVPIYDINKELIDVVYLNNLLYRDGYPTNFDQHCQNKVVAPLGVFLAATSLGSMNSQSGMPKNLKSWMWPELYKATETDACIQTGKAEVYLSGPNKEYITVKVIESEGSPMPNGPIDIYRTIDRGAAIGKVPTQLVMVDNLRTPAGSKVIPQRTMGVFPIMRNGEIARTASNNRPAIALRIFDQAGGSVGNATKGNIPLLASADRDRMEQARYDYFVNEIKYGANAYNNNSVMKLEANKTAFIFSSLDNDTGYNTRLFSSLKVLPVDQSKSVIGHNYLSTARYSGDTPESFRQKCLACENGSCGASEVFTTFKTKFYNDMGTLVTDYPRYLAGTGTAGTPQSWGNGISGCLIQPAGRTDHLGDFTAYAFGLNHEYIVTSFRSTTDRNGWVGLVFRTAKGESFFSGPDVNTPVHGAVFAHMMGQSMRPSDSFNSPMNLPARVIGVHNLGNNQFAINHFDATGFESKPGTPNENGQLGNISVAEFAQSFGYSSDGLFNQDTKRAMWQGQIRVGIPAETTVRAPASIPSFICGDVNNDGRAEYVDAVWANALVRGTAPSNVVLNANIDAADLNGNGAIEQTEVDALMGLYLENKPYPSDLLSYSCANIKQLRGYK